MAEIFETTKEMNKKPSTKLKIVAVVVVLVILVLALFLSGVVKMGKVDKIVVTAGVPEGYKFTVTKTGEYPLGFPKELVLFEGVKILRGENTTDAAGVNHKIIEYSVAQSGIDISSQYQSKLLPLKWKLSGQPIIQNGLQMLNFAKDKMTLTVVISVKDVVSSQVSLDVVGAPDVKSAVVQVQKPILPKDFPAEFLVDKEAQLVLAVPAEKMGLSSNVIFLSKITQGEFLTKLVSSLKSAKWEIVSQKQDESMSQLFATKGSKIINFYSFKLSNNYTEAHYEYAQ